MKKAFLIGCLLAATCALEAQVNVVTMTHSGDTATGSVSKHTDVAPQKSYTTMSFQAVITKVSGTVAGYSLLQGSNDGVNYKDITTDTLTHANQATNTKIWIINNAPYSYFRINTVGTGTMAAICKGYAMGNISAYNAAASVFLSSYGNASDTVTNTATNTVTCQVKGGYNVLSIQPVITKISGTAAGTVTLQGSLDGTNYVTANTTYISGGSATLSVTNQTTNTRLYLITTGTIYKYYRLSYTGSGTMSCTLKGYLAGR